MKDFSVDIESKLEKAYKTGASKKYGYDGITKLSQAQTDANEENKKENKMLNKISNQA